MSNIFTTLNLTANGLYYRDLQFKEGLTTFITGPSGVGKSTLLKLFNGMFSPSSGQVYYFDRNISQEDTILLRRDVSLVSQDLFLFDLTIENNFKEFYAYRELPPPSIPTMERFLSLCCLELPLTSHCSRLSGGERQRVYTAIFLSLMPKVLLLDEPTSALDSQNSKVFFENIVRFCKEHAITLIVISHDKILADSFSDEQIEIVKSDRR